MQWSIIPYQEPPGNYNQNLLNAQKQGAYIDSQRASQEYLMNVVMPAQAAMMYAQGNAANSSAAYSSQLAAQSKEII